MWILLAAHDLNRPLAIEGLLEDNLPRFLPLTASDSLTSLGTSHERSVRSGSRNRLKFAGRQPLAGS